MNTTDTMTLREAGLLVRISFRKFAPKKQNKRSVLEYAANHGSSASMHKHSTLVVPEEFTAPISKFETGVRQNIIYKYTHPWERDGASLLPAPLIPEFQREVGKLQQEHAQLVEEFLNNYDDIVEEAKRRLNGDFNPRNYPSREEVRRRFSMEVAYAPVPCANDYRFDIVEEIKHDTERVVAQRFAEAQRKLRERLVDKLEHLAERCDAKSADTKSKFAESNITHILELIDLIPKMLIGDDPEMEAAVQTASAMLSGIDADTLKTSDYVREDVAKKAREIANSLVC